MAGKYEQFETKMQKSIAALDSDLNTLRAGRANPAVLDKISVEYYGVASPIAQVASIAVPDARTIIIQPWDASIVSEIEKAIQKSELGLNPQNDGKSIRLNFPPLTEERRKEIVKEVGKKGENAKVAVRSIRRDAMDFYKNQKKNSEITEDDLKGIEKDIQTLTDKYIKEIDDTCAKKEKEILSV
ncbi:MAG: ribosome recycling factor [Ruminococcaceae bacterium]|nr:ribosome recycling factor [Oscillospiraceae bacterium]